MTVRNLAVGLLLASSALADDRAALVNLFHSNLNRYVSAHAAMTATDRVDTFIGDAIARGVLRTPADIVQAKQFYLELVTAYEATSGAGQTGNGIVLNPASITETENNDTLGLADVDTVSGVTVLSGTIGPTTAGVTFDPRDTYSVTVPQGAYNFSVSYNNTALTTPPIVQLSDTVGRFFLQSLQFTPGAAARQINVELPGGVYTLTVLPGVTASANPYTVTITPITITRTAAANAFADLCASGPISDALAAARDIHCYRLNVTTDSLVNLRVTAAVPVNAAFLLANSKSGRLLVIDNIGASNDPSLVMALPAANYIVYVLDSVGTNVGPYTISATCTPQAITPLPCGTAVAGNLLTLDQKDLYTVGTTTLDSVSIQTTLGGLTDTVIEYYDRNMSPLAENDDAVGFASFIKLPLPLGTYYASVRPFAATGALGTYGITATCGPLQTITNLTNEQTTATLNIASLDSTAFRHIECTATHLEISASTTSARLSVYGADGLCRGWYGIGGAPGSVGSVGTAVRANDTIYVVARTLSGTGTLASWSLYALGGIGLTNGWATSTGTLQVLDKVGGSHIVFLGNALGSPFSFPPIAGFICQDLSYFSTFLPTVTGNGRNAYAILTGNLPSFGPTILWQGLYYTFSTFGFAGRMTNTVQ